MIGTAASLAAVVFCLLGPLALAETGGDLSDVFTQDTTHFLELLKSPVAERRVEGVQGLSHLKHWPAERALIGLLNDPSPQVRREAAFALCWLGTRESIPYLIDLLKDDSWEVRQHAWLALTRMTARDLDCEPDAWKAWWQGSAGSHEQALLERLKVRGADPEQTGLPRKKALRALKHLAGPSAETALIELLSKAQDPPLDAEESAFALGALERVGTERAVPCVARYRVDAAAWALGRMGGPQAEEALLQFPKTLPVLIALDRLKCTKCAPFIDQLVGNFGLVTFRGQPDDLYMDPTPIQRVAANLILRSGEAPKVTDLILYELEATLKTPLARLRPVAPSNLAPVLERMREELKPGFVRNDGLTTSQPLTALYHIANDRALAPRLIPLLRHPAFVPRVYVAMVLGKLHATEATPAILEIIREGYPFTDATALVSGKHFGHSQTVRWRGFFCMALGRMGGDEARQALEGLASDPAGCRDIRYGAVVGLGFIGSPKSLAVLRKVAENDIIRMVRETARQTAADIELTTKSN